jgi:hypothetical protein
MSRGLALARAIGWKWSPTSSDDENTNEITVEGLVEDALAQRVGDGPLSRLIAGNPDNAADDTESADGGEGSSVATIGDMRKSVTSAAISAIEDDIASLLATMNGDSDAAAAADQDGIDAEDATLALLGELDRMWRADPMVGGGAA